MARHNRLRGRGRDLAAGAVSENKEVDNHHSDNSGSEGQPDVTTPINPIASGIQDAPAIVQAASIEQFRDLRNEIVGQLQTMQQDLIKTQSDLITTQSQLEKAITDNKIMREKQSESESRISLMTKEISKLRQQLAEQERLNPYTRILDDSWYQSIEDVKDSISDIRDSVQKAQQSVNGKIRRVAVQSTLATESLRKDMRRTAAAVQTEQAEEIGGLKRRLSDVSHSLEDERAFTRTRFEVKGAVLGDLDLDELLSE